MNQQDLHQLEELFRKIVREESVTKEEFKVLRSEFKTDIEGLRNEFKLDLDDAVAQITDAADRTKADKETVNQIDRRVHVIEDILNVPQKA